VAGKRMRHRPAYPTARAGVQDNFARNAGVVSGRKRLGTGVALGEGGGSHYLVGLLIDDT